MSKKLTERSVQAAKAETRPTYHFDSELTGFGLKVTPTGAKTFFYQWRDGPGRSSRVKRVTIGRYGKVTVHLAREQARQHAAAVAQGGDPAADRTEMRREPNIGDLCRRYLDEHVERHNKPSTQKEMRRLVEKRILPELGIERVRALTRRRIAEWHGAMSAMPYEANRSLACLSKIMALAVNQWEIAAENPCRGVRRFAERERDRFLSLDELSALGRAIDDARGKEWPGALVAIRTLALTGMRLGEALNLRWSDVDLHHGLIRLRDAKAGARTVPLGVAAVRFLRTVEQASVWVCQGLDPEKPLAMSTFHKVWRRICSRAKLENTRPHDLRHAAGTYAALAGANQFAVRDLLGHKTMAMSGRYVERAAQVAKSAADLVSEQLADALGEPSASIMDLSKAD